MSAPQPVSVQLDAGAVAAPALSPAPAGNQTEAADGDQASTETQLMVSPTGSDGEAGRSDLPTASSGQRIWDAVLKLPLGSWATSAAAIVVGIIAWHFATTNQISFILNFQNIPTPLSVWDAFLNQLSRPVFYTHILVSMQRILLAYAIAAGMGIVLGVLVGRSQLARDVILPYVEIFRPIPAVAWIPLAILMWPTEEASIIYITFLGALFPIILNTAHGVSETPDVLVRAARSLGANRLQIFRHVVLPAALPNIATGLSVGMGVAWFSLLAGEIISGQYGIGYFTWNAYSLINYEDIVVGMLCIGLLGTGSTYAVQLATRPFLRWQEKAR